MIYKHPRILAVSVESLQAKHDFIVGQWGRSVEEIEIFPQSLTYSLTYLRTRAGFLTAAGHGSSHHLHRILRTADYLFAKKLAGGRAVEEYQAFARAMAEGSSAGGGSEGGEAASFEQLASDTMAQVPDNRLAEVSAGDKHLAMRLGEMHRDQELSEAVESMRRAIDQFVQGGEGGAAAAPTLSLSEEAAASRSELSMHAASDGGGEEVEEAVIEDGDERGVGAEAPGAGGQD
jgi:hypothetical protein